MSSYEGKMAETDCRHQSLPQLHFHCQADVSHISILVIIVPSIPFSRIHVNMGSQVKKEAKMSDMLYRFKTDEPRDVNRKINSTMQSLIGAIATLSTTVHSQV